jgi:hypothetical protein
MAFMPTCWGRAAMIVLVYFFPVVADVVTPLYFENAKDMKDTCREFAILYGVSL